MHTTLSLFGTAVNSEVDGNTANNGRRSPERSGLEREPLATAHAGYTLDGMAAKPTDAGEGSGAGDTPAEREGEGAQERYGPLRVERHRKDDGRALILYTRPETPQT
jgi:hypothetical protein